MKKPHFRPEQYTEWFCAQTTNPYLPGWYECTGWRFNGMLHLYWSGTSWHYFGPPHVDPLFPAFGEHPSDAWRGIIVQHVRRKRTCMVDDIEGQRFGMLVALQLEYTTHHGAFWMFRCDCGQKRLAQAKWVIAGNTASCGCMRYKKGSIAISRPWDRTPLRRGITTRGAQQSTDLLKKE